jgi:hypothetical protein
MTPVAAFPIHDPDGIMFPHLERITPLLKELFSSVYIGVSVATQQNFPEKISWLESYGFFQVMKHQSEDIVGRDFLALYAHAASSCEPGQVVHLCFTDRVAYALQSEHRGAFSADIHSLAPAGTPLMFQRSERAWQTHPANYRAIEGMVTTAGELLFGRSLDYAWCHIALQARRLLEIIPQVKINDNGLSFFAEIVLAIRHDARTKDVDWLSWEDPFITANDATALKQDRENSVDETRKRLIYVIPMLQLLVEASQ